MTHSALSVEKKVQEVLTEPWGQFRRGLPDSQQLGFTDEEVTLPRPQREQAQPSPLCCPAPPRNAEKPNVHTAGGFGFPAKFIVTL